MESGLQPVILSLELGLLLLLSPRDGKSVRTSYAKGRTVDKVKQLANDTHLKGIIMPQSTT